MKKGLILVVFMVVFTVVVFGQETRRFTTSNGTWSCQIQHIGSNKGQENAELFGGHWSGNTRIERLSNNQEDLVLRMLNLYRPSRSDTYFLTLSFWPQYWDRPHPFNTLIVIVEFRSNTDWVYWAYNMNI